MNGHVRMILLSAGVFAIATAGNVAARSMYTNSKLGVDKSTLIISSAIAVGVGYLLISKVK